MTCIIIAPISSKAQQEAAAAAARAMNGGAKPKIHKVHKLEKAASVATEMVAQHESLRPQPARPNSARTAGGKGQDMDDDSFFDLLTKFQSRRIDDQRCSFRVLEKQNSQNGASAGGACMLSYTVLNVFILSASVVTHLCHFRRILTYFIQA